MYQAEAMAITELVKSDEWLCEGTHSKTQTGYVDALTRNSYFIAFDWFS